MEKLEDIGFYTLSDYRAKQASLHSPLWRCELILTDKCNFKCPYCRGLSYKGNMNIIKANEIIDLWLSEDLQNIRFSGGEPTIYPYLSDLVSRCKGVSHIAISTNGSASLDYYKKLIQLGVNDFSISLDSGCCNIGDKMTGGIKGSWKHTVDIIKVLSKETYVTLGMVFTEQNITTCLEDVLFADSLGVSDIRVIPAAQYNKALITLSNLSSSILSKYPILSYRVNNIRNGKSVRGTERHSCPIVLDDMAVVGDLQYPCIIYLREGGKPIGKMSNNFRLDRYNWYLRHNPAEDSICSENCLDVCVDYNNKYDCLHN